MSTKPVAPKSTIEKHAKASEEHAPVVAQPPSPPPVTVKSEPLTADQIAIVCHEANRAYCLAVLGDTSQMPWEASAQYLRESAIKGAQFHIENPGSSAAASHDSWLRDRKARGWKFGPVKDEQKKEHPCFVPFDELPEAQQRKDRLFAAIVEALR